MELTHRFTVPTPVEETWSHFQDITALAECFPGAQVTSADADGFEGSCKVKLGPIALVYNGSGTFTEKDEAAHRFVVDAKGKDKRGNGTAGAKVTVAMVAADAGGTDVDVHTDLAITGKPAQFGRGVMQDVSDKLLGQFVACLEERLAGIVRDDRAVEQLVPPTPSSRTIPTGPGEVANEAASEVASEAAVDQPPAARPAPAPTSAAQDDALDLGATVLPVLARSYWKQGVAGLGLLLLVVWLIRRH